jgi:hypothetical protein
MIRAAFSVFPEQLVYKRPSCDLHTTARCLDLTAAAAACFELVMPRDFLIVYKEHYRRN